MGIRESIKKRPQEGVKKIARKGEEG